MAHGKFITFEGGEGSGKSTQSRLLAERLRARGLDAVLTREPGGSPFAEVLRSLILDAATPPHSALAEALLFFAARADHLEKVVRPALAAGRWVICDRFTDSTRVYQGDAGKVPMATIDALETIVVEPTVPDLTLIVDLDPREGLARVSGRSADAASDAYEKRDRAYHERLRFGYLALAAAEPGRCVVIDGAKSLNEVTAAIWAAVEGRLFAGAS